MDALSALGVFFAQIANATANWLGLFVATGVPVVACIIFLACFGLFERLVLRRLLHYNPATSVRKERGTRRTGGQPVGDPHTLTLNLPSVKNVVINKGRK